MSDDRKRTSIRIIWSPQREVYRVKFTASEGTFHQVVAALKKIDFANRSYNSANREWSIAPSELETLRGIATEFFDDAQLTEGSLTTNLHTGRVCEQLTLFP